MDNIEIEDRHVKWVEDNVERHFTEKKIRVTHYAKFLIALSVQAQFIEGESELNTENLMSQADQLIENALVPYYIYTYGDKDLDYNRAIHVIADWSPMIKYPWTPTGPRGLE